MFSTPSFWRDQSIFNWRSHLLLPLSYLYGLGRAFDVKHAHPLTVRIPVICIGNLTAGGAGKTPVALAVLKLIKTKKIAQKPYFLTRGYGGSIKAPTLVDVKKHTSKEVGDEALLLAAKAKTIISANRYEGAELAAKHGADIIIMDDGFQNTSLEKDLSVVVVDGHYGFGNQRLVPAGPLREKINDGLARADIIIMIGDDKHFLERSYFQDKTVIHATVQPNTRKVDKNERYLAFAGLGRPRKFQRTLEDLNFHVTGWQTFADHYQYTKEDIETLQTNASALKSKLITTEKDFVRMKSLGVDLSEIVVLPITLTLDSNDALIKNIESIL